MDGVAAGTLRWRRAEPDVVKFERVAVLSAYRGRGIGAALNRWAIDAAGRAPGVRAIRLGAQETATGFYARLGFQTEGAPFVDAGIAHRWMRRDLG